MTIRTGQEWPYPGARWWKFDFHTHTPASADYGKGENQDSLRQITPEDWLLGFMRAEVDCVAVTDHNSGEWIDKLKSALRALEQHSEFRQLYLFPGVEVTANGSTHVLALFDPTKGSSDVDKLLGDVEYRGDPGASDHAADEAPIGVVEAICKSGGIPILAHVDSPSGAWRLRGNTLGPLLDAIGLFAIEVVDSESEHPGLYRQRNLTWAEVLGSDSHHPAGGTGERFPGSHYTWVKMAEPSLEGLRLALLDGEGFSIRRSDQPEPFDPFALPKHHIEAIEISDARYMGRGEPTKLQFSPWLNALVGGRGTGKSTVIYALRLASRRERELEKLGENSSPRLTFKRFNRTPTNRMEEGGLTDNTSIQWVVMRDRVRHRVHWRKDDTGTAVEEESDSGAWTQSSAQSVSPGRFPVRLFSQGQIAELAGENQQALLQVIDEAAGVAPLDGNLDKARNEYYAVQAKIRELDSKLEGRDNLTVELQDVERKLERFEEGHSTVLTTYRLRQRQRREVDRQFEVAAAAAQRIEDTAAELQLDDLPDDLFDEARKEDRQVVDAIAKLAEAEHTAAQGLRNAAKRLRETTGMIRLALSKGAWQTAVEHASGSYQELIERLQAEGISDPSEYGPLVQERQHLDGRMKEMESRQEERDRLVGQSEERLQNVLEARRTMSDARTEFLCAALKQNNFVQIDIQPYGDDPLAIEHSLREALDVLDDRFQDDILVMEDGRPVNGIVAALLRNLPAEAEHRRAAVEHRLDDLRHRFASACDGKGSFGGHFNNYLERQYKRGPDFLDRLLAWFPEDGLSIEYSRGGDGTDFQPIKQASAGQRSAAMLAFLLAHGEEPLVLDQPEDDLDNHLIYDLIVRQIRENKLRRQIILVTHNPNIVVNGDAEMLHAFDFHEGQCIVARSGSLQEGAMREEVCRIMEGGREAFKRRYRRLGPG